MGAESSGEEAQTRSGFVTWVYTCDLERQFYWMGNQMLREVKSLPCRHSMVILNKTRIWNGLCLADPRESAAVYGFLCDLALWREGVDTRSEGGAGWWRVLDAQGDQCLRV